MFGGDNSHAHKGHFIPLSLKRINAFYYYFYYNFSSSLVSVLVQFYSIYRTQCAAVKVLSNNIFHTYNISIIAAFSLWSFHSICVASTNIGLATAYLCRHRPL